MRRDHLRGYILALVQDGVFSPSDSPDAILKKVGIAIRDDVKCVLSDLGRNAAANGLRAASGMLQMLLDGVAARVGGGRRG